MPFGWGDWRGMLRLIEMTARARGLRRPAGRGRAGASPSPCTRGDAPASTRSSGSSCPPTRRARSRACPSATPPPRAGAATTTRARRRSTRRATIGAAPRASPSSRCGASTSPRVGDSLVLCRFTSERGFGLYIEEPYARMVSAVTGWDVTVEELERVGERVINLERLFNVREGVRRDGRRAAVARDARAHSRGALGGHVLPARGAGPCSTTTMRCAAGTATACRRRSAWARSASSPAPSGARPEAPSTLLR